MCQHVSLSPLTCRAGMVCKLGGGKAKPNPVPWFCNESSCRREKCRVKAVQMPGVAAPEPLALSQRTDEVSLAGVLMTSSLTD